jgi:hypothetical protein
LWAGAGCALGLGLSAAYLLPAALEQDLIRKEYVLNTWPYHKTYVFVHDLFNYKLFREFFACIDFMWIFSTVSIIALAVALLVFGRKAPVLDRPLRERVMAWVILGSFASYMMTEWSRPVGALLPKVEIGVFAWRMLSISTLVIALLIAACAQATLAARESDSKSRGTLYVSLASVIMVIGIAYSVLYIVAPVANTPAFEPEDEHLNPAMIPSTVPVDLDELPDDVPPAEFAEENGELTVEKWEPEHRVVRVDLKDEDSLLIRTFNFPGWAATVDGDPAEIITGEELGDIVIELPAGRHEVRLDFQSTPTRRAGNLISLSSFGILILMVIAPFFLRARKHAREARPAPR